MNRLRLLLVAGVAAALSSAVGAPAIASPSQQSILQDDRLLLDSGAATRDATLDELRSLGVDSVRVFASWRGLAPAASSTRKPAVDLTNPSSYGDWSALDDVVRGAAARGLSVLLTPTGPGPAWAGKCSGSIRRRQACYPDPGAFQAFVIALGRRYPGVAHWAVYNEPNVAQYLYPQAIRRGGSMIPIAPTLYRRLVYAAYDGLAASGHGGDQVIVGETAPIGHRAGNVQSTPMATAAFWRAFFCLNDSGRKLTGGKARLAGCTGAFRKLALNAVSTHPYQRGGSRSPAAADRRDEITMSSLWKLKAVLRAGKRAGRSTNGAPPIYLTEYGVQSRPPDRRLGVPLNTQAKWINEADYMAFLDKQVAGVSQYLLRDDIPLSGFQSGLRFKNGKAKPAWYAYRLPLWVVKHGSKVNVFAQVRPARGASATVDLQWRRGSRGRWKTLKTLTAGGGRDFIFTTDRYRAGGRWRLRWSPGSGTEYSREATASPI